MLEVRILSRTPRPGGGIGRHAALNQRCRKACGFDSRPGHATLRGRDRCHAERVRRHRAGRPKETNRSSQGPGRQRDLGTHAGEAPAGVRPPRKRKMAGSTPVTGSTPSWPRRIRHPPSKRAHAGSSPAEGARPRVGVAAWMHARFGSGRSRVRIPPTRLRLTTTASGSGPGRSLARDQRGSG